MSLNHIMLIGNLGDDPKLRETKGDRPMSVCNFSLAVNEKVKSDGEWEEITLWFKVTVWGKQAEVAEQYLSKGSPVCVIGKLGVEEWVDREDNNRFTLTVNASDVRFIGGGGDGESSGEKKQVKKAPPKSKYTENELNPEHPDFVPVWARI
jgi:single-strand DNA-binding protein